MAIPNGVTDLQAQTTNNLIPLCPSTGASILQENVQLAADGLKVNDATNLFSFNWIQAFWDTEVFVGIPILAVYAGAMADNGDPIVVPIQFAYSGERVYFHGKLIFDEGVDRLGNTIVSTPIGEAADSNISALFIYGGYGS